MKIEEYDVVIKEFTMKEIKELLGEGRTDVRIRMNIGNPIQRAFVPPEDSKFIIETWEKKIKKCP